MRQFRSRLWGQTWVTIRSKIAPLEVHLLDQMDLLLTPPGFDLLLARDRIPDLAEFLEVDKRSDVVSRGERFRIHMVPMAHDAPGEIVRDADV